MPFFQVGRSCVKIDTAEAVKPPADATGGICLLRRRDQRLIFWILTVVISAGLVGSSVVWSGLFSAPAPRTPVAQKRSEPSTTLRELETAAQANPRDVSAYLRLAAAFLEEGEAAKAIDAYRHVLVLDPRNGAARLSLAEIYLAQDKPDEALEQLDALLAVYPDHATALYRRGLLLGLVKGDTRAGAADLERFVKIAGTGPDVDYAKTLIAAWRGGAAAQP